MNRKQKIIISITGITIVLLALVGLTYGYYLTVIKGNLNPNSISLTTEKLELVYGETGGYVIGDNETIEPNKTFEPKTFTVTNTGDDVIDSYAVVLENVSTTYASTTDKVTEGQVTTFESTTKDKENDFTLVVTCKNQDNEECNGYNAELLESNGILLTNSIEPEETQTYTAVLTYNDTKKNQSADMNKKYTAKFNIIDTKDTIDISGTVSNYELGDYVQTNSTKRVSVINPDGSYKIVGLEVGKHELKVCGSNVTNCTKSNAKLTETISIVKGDKASVDNETKTITITDDLRTVNADIDVNNNTIKGEIPSDEKNIVFMDNVTNIFTESIAREELNSKAFKKSFTITNDSNEKMFVDISLDDINLPSALKRYDFMYALYEVVDGVEKGLSYGSFEHVEGNVEIIPNQMFDVGEEKTYYLYLWIEETGLVQTSMMNQTFGATIKATEKSYWETPASCFNYDKEFDGLMVVYGYDVATCGTDVVIPETIDGITVKYIYGGFESKNLTSVVIPDTVTHISSNSFQNNNLTSIVIPNSITQINSYAFYGNNLTNIIIPNSVTYIGEQVFAYNKLTNVVIPNSVTEIGQFAFDNNKLTSLIIPNSVETINYSAFQVNELTTAIIGDGVTGINDGAFAVNKLTNLVIGDNVISIGYVAFGSNELTSITIPNSVKYISSAAFNTNPLTSIIIKRANSTGMELSEFWNCIDLNYSDNTCNKYIEPQYIP